MNTLTHTRTHQKCSAKPKRRALRTCRKKACRPWSVSTKDRAGCGAGDVGRGGGCKTMGRVCCKAFWGD
eukprot:1143998-Pelagomonas_calceolata.AAC.1